ncbi:hypothetical protein Ahy_A09g046481 isoform G [Arachis hypogaea]|uniref:Bifunctional inhibitor/plant lipid transfer protein/seed storage helical domain-containing protein n=1 Tax=Arachis hypogaea TaxID=3818 RepID=A0A445BQ36_ARAHY|nr:hypothetical protein Ahy_A09g046481 isoform G [Arachis hypogaea]
MAKLSLGNIFLLSLLVSSVMWMTSSDGAASSSQFITEDTTLCRYDFMFDDDCKHHYPHRCVEKCYAKYHSKLILGDCMKKYANVFVMKISLCIEVGNWNELLIECGTSIASENPQQHTATLIVSQTTLTENEKIQLLLTCVYYLYPPNSFSDQ